MHILWQQENLAETEIIVIFFSSREKDDFAPVFNFFLSLQEKFKAELRYDYIIFKIIS